MLCIVYTYCGHTVWPLCGHNIVATLCGHTVTTRHRFRHYTSYVLQCVHNTCIQYMSHICVHAYKHTYTYILRVTSTRHRFRHYTSHVLQCVHNTCIQHMSHIFHGITRHIYCTLQITYIVVCPQYMYTIHVKYVACHSKSHILHNKSCVCVCVCECVCECVCIYCSVSTIHVYNL